MAHFLDYAGLTRFFAGLKNVFAAKSHTHAAGDITSGTLNAGRLPVMVGATSNAAGTVGAVPAPSLGYNDTNSPFFLNGGGIWQRVPVMLGATQQNYGREGLVPTPGPNYYDAFLCGDGTWKKLSESGSFATVFLRVDLDTENGETWADLLSTSFTDGAYGLSVSDSTARQGGRFILSRVYYDGEPLNQDFRLYPYGGEYHLIFDSLPSDATTRISIVGRIEYENTSEYISTLIPGHVSADPPVKVLYTGYWRDNLSMSSGDTENLTYTFSDPALDGYKVFIAETNAGNATNNGLGVSAAHIYYSRFNNSTGVLNVNIRNLYSSTIKIRLATYLICVRSDLYEAMSL